MRVPTAACLAAACLVGLGAAAFAADAPKPAPAPAADAKPAYAPIPAVIRGFTRNQIQLWATQLDANIEQGLKAGKIQYNRPATDAEFVRRLHLDVLGRVPTVEEARAFLNDGAPDKRARLIDQLLANPARAMHDFNWLADLLRVRDDYGRGSRSFMYQDWLKQQLEDDVAWDKMTRAMLTADGRLLDDGPAGFILRDADMPLDGISYMLTTFLGANVGCAQCHDHPMADWSQRNFYEVAAFFGACDTRDERVLQQGNRAIKSSGSASMDLEQRGRLLLNSNSLRVADGERQTLRLPSDYQYEDGKPRDPVSPKLLFWDPAESKSGLTRKVDTRSAAKLRAEFADWLTAPENPRFSVNIANRTWKKVFGRAILEPVNDIDHLDKAANPALLQKAAEVMRAVRFDRLQFERVLYNTRAYQAAACVAPAPDDGPYLFPGPLLRRMTAEQAWDSTLALGVGASVDQLKLRRGDQSKTLVLDTRDITVESIEAVLAKAEESGMLPGRNGGNRARGMLTQYEGGHPQVIFNPGDRRNSLVLARASELPQPSPENHFLRQFGQSERLVAESSTRDGSIPQMLMMMNGPVSEIVTRPSAAIVQEALKGRSAGEQIDILYLGFFARLPSEGERNRGIQAVRDGMVLSDLAWTLLNSREFLFIN